MGHYRIARPGARAREIALIVALVAAPLVVALLWGVPLGEAAYVAYAQGRNLAAGRAVNDGLAEAGLPSPTPVLLWALLARLGMPLLPASAVLSALGWSATALALYAIGHTLGRPLGGAFAALAVAFNPLVASTLGTEVPWALALFFVSLWFALRGRWRVVGLVAAWLLWLYLDWALLAWGVVLLGMAGRRGRCFPLRSTVLLAFVVAARVLLALASGPVALPGLSLAGWRQLGQVGAESEWYWLALPLIGLGFAALSRTQTDPRAQLGIDTPRQGRARLAMTGKEGVLGRRALWIGLLGCLLVSVGDGALGGACLVAACALLAGLGVDQAARWAQAEAHISSFRIARYTVSLSACLAVIAFLPLGAAHLGALRSRAPARAHAQYAVEQEVGRWLAARSAPAETVMGSARIAYLADRPLTLWNGTAREQAQLPAWIDVLNAAPPAYCVSSNTIAWNRLTRTGWFQERYALLARYGTAQDARSPYLVWGYRASAYDRGVRRSVQADLAAGVRLVGSRHWPTRIAPGDAVYVTVYLEATAPVARAFESSVRVYSPSDGTHWAHRNQIVPRSIPVDWWQPGQVIAERVVLTTTVETPVGAYPLDLSVGGVEGAILGYVSVPWRGTMAGVTPVEATFSDQIRLLGYAAPARGTPGAPIEVTLYWEALRPPDDNYVVFLHLVDPAGQLATDGDGPPMGGRYPSRGWLPGDVVPDARVLTLGADAPAGTYALKVGLYTWPAVERLPAWDGAGNALAERAVLLGEIEIR